MRAFSCPVFVLVRARINKDMTTIDLPPSLALSDDEEGLDYGKDGDDDKEEEHHSRGASGRAGGGGSGVRNWHLDDVNAWKAKRALIRKRKEKEERRLKKEAAKTAAAAAAAKAAGPKRDS